jgi:hypothetical protein
MKSTCFADTHLCNHEELLKKYPNVCSSFQSGYCNYQVGIDAILEQSPEIFLLNPDNYSW